MRYSLAAIVIGLLLSGCAEGRTEVRYVPVPAEIDVPQVEQPDYPNCALAREGELCEEYGRVKVKAPDVPSCAFASEGEVCEEYGKTKVKVQPCYLAQSGEICEEFGSTKVKEGW